MATEDNVVKMPIGLERRAQKIDAALDRQRKANDNRDRSDNEWREATLELAIELAGAKADLNNDLQKFGKWCDGRFGDNALPPNERGILGGWGADPEGTRTMLAKTDSRSIRMIEQRFHSTVKTLKTTPPREEVEAAVEEHLARTGEYPSVQTAARESGWSRIVVEPALAAVKARNSVAPTELRFTKAQEAHVEARIRAEVKAAIEQLHRSFEKEVEKRNKSDIDKLFPDLERMREDARRTEKLYRGLIEKQAIFTEAEYRDILLCTHEGNPSKETRERAFIAFNTKKLQLTGKL